LTGAFLCALKVLPGMISRNKGRIVNVGSIAGFKGYAYMAAYGASKAGLVGFTRALAVEVGDKGVTVNAVCPSFVDSPLTHLTATVIAEKQETTKEAVIAAWHARGPQNRLFTAEEVAEAVAFLASDAAGGVNGAVLTLDGGELVA
jgi:NAD(P)-dependent dehydrogenase (short-subunit alcohol dehydrogenase family)